MSDELEVLHDHAVDVGGRFHLHRDGAHLGELDYRGPDAGVVVANHTEVDDSLRGQGAGRRLFDAFIAWVNEHDYKVVPSCPYVARQIDKDPALARFLAE